MVYANKQTISKTKMTSPNEEASARKRQTHHNSKEKNPQESYPHDAGTN